MKKDLKEEMKRAIEHGDILLQGQINDMLRHVTKK